MSGVAVLLHRDGRPIDRQALEAMLAAAAYRGPDGLGVHTMGAIGLGHARMIVTAEDCAEQQPLVSPRTGCAIVADVRLDNRDELLARLPERLPALIGDAELILRAYEAWGVEALPRLLGDFAFAIWDPRQRNVICARDTSGQRSLFYRVDRTTFAAASEIHQLFQDPSVSIEPDEERIRDFLVPYYVYSNQKDTSATFFAGIQSVPAGCSLVVSSDSVRVQRYWQLAPSDVRYRRDEEYAEHFRELLFEAVRARLRTIMPVGAMLSGGLDSGSVVCTAQELYRSGQAVDHGFTTYSCVFESNPECDEREFVRDVQAKYGFQSRLLPAAEFSNHLELEPRGFVDGPRLRVNDGADRLMTATSEDGVGVLLTGEVADSYVGGSPLVFDSLLRQGQWRACWDRWQAFRRTAEEPVRTTLAFGCVLPLLPIALQRQLLAYYVRRSIQRHWSALVPAWMPAPLREDLTRRHLALSVAAQQQRRFSNPGQEADYRLLYPPELTMAPSPWSLELRHPYADRRLHEFVLGVPPELKFAPHPVTDEYYAGSKRLVREAMRGMLPESIRTRTSKTIFSGVFGREVARQWPVFEAVFGPNGRSEVAARGYIESEAFWRRLGHLRERGAAGDLVFLLRMVGLETWLRRLAQSRSDLVTVPPAKAPAHAATGMPGPRDARVLTA